MPVAINTAATLDAKCPLDAHVRIEIKPLMGRWGQSWFDEETCEYRIEVNPLVAQEPDFLAETLMHEWAHCLTRCDCPADHCEHWGVNYARCYRACVEE